eukprot:scaffold84_cov388-Prasinococcus_capsulatus_cf.AAC.9
MEGNPCQRSSAHRYGQDRAPRRCERLNCVRASLQTGCAQKGHLDVLLAAEQDLDGAVHLSDAETSVVTAVLVVNLIGHLLPGGRQLLAPRTPGGVEVDHYRRVGADKAVECPGRCQGQTSGDRAPPGNTIRPHPCGRFTSERAQPEPAHSPRARAVDEGDCGHVRLRGGCGPQSREAAGAGCRRWDTCARSWSGSCAGCPPYSAEGSLSPPRPTHRGHCGPGTHRILDVD